MEYGPGAHARPFLSNGARQMAKTDETMVKVRVERKYWPLTATGDNDALDIGTIIDLPQSEAFAKANDGVVSLVLPEK